MEILKRTLARLPEEGECVWEGVWIRLPEWVTGEDRPPFRPWSFVWVNPAVDLIGSPPGLVSKDERSVDLALRGLMAFAQNRKHAQSRPTIVVVNDEDLAIALEVELADLRIDVLYESNMDRQKMLQADFYEFSKPDYMGPSILDGQDVTLERVRSFADAAARFHAAAPWELLTSNDPIAIQSNQRPAPAMVLSHAAVLGADGEGCSVAFCESLEVFKERAYPLDRDLGELTRQGARLWGVMFAPMSCLPLLDADLWEDEALPVAGEKAYPFPVCFQGATKLERPNATDLLHMEVCLRTLANVSEDELDTGRIQRTVATGDGPIEVAMTLPFLLDPPPREQVLEWGFEPDRRAGEKATRALDALARTQTIETREDLQRIIEEQITGRTLDDLPADLSPPGQAMEFCFQAYDSIGWRKRQLARQALAIDPDCAEAYVLLGEATPNPARALTYFEQGVAAGRRALGEDRFETDRGHFWKQNDTRPYARALRGMVAELIALGRTEESWGLCWSLLDLDRGDHLGVRHDFLLTLMEASSYEDALRLVERFPQERQPAFPYVRALLVYRRDGNTAEAWRLLIKAMRVSRMVADFLLDPKKREKATESPDFELNLYSRNRAVKAYLSTIPLLQLYEELPGIHVWLRAGLEKVRGRT